MIMMSVYCSSILVVLGFLQVLGVLAHEDIKISHDGPVVLGGTITFRADVFESDGSIPQATYRYEWSDNALFNKHTLVSETTNTTSFFTVSYPASEGYDIGFYGVEVKLSKKVLFWWNSITSRRTEFEVTQLLNGNMSIAQSNKTVKGIYVSSGSESNITVDLRSGDAKFITDKATSVSTFWFVDCKYYGQTNDFSFKTNFTTENVTHNIEALVVASFEPPQTTTPAPTTTTTVPTPSNTTIPSNSSTPASNFSTTPSPTTLKPTTSMTTIAPNATTNVSFPFVCLNSSVIPPDPNKTYGYFSKEVTVKAPIGGILVEGTNWIRPWDMLSLNVSCKGSGPFYKCLEFHRGKYNVTGNETCYDTDRLHSCNFSIIHYFLEPSVSTIVMIIQNDVSTQIYPITVNIYSATVQPQLSVIVVPVSCSLVAVVLVIFGIAYYIQSRARFTVEVADFDFGKSNSEMEYKTFRERLRDSFNNAGYKPLHDSQILQ